VTNSSLCTFGDQFNLLFTPSFKDGTGIYKLSASNPGQFYYNVFTPDSNGTITMEIPYPFVTMGATPIHVYSGVTIVEDENGDVCLTPGTELANFQTQITLETYGTGSSTIVTLTGLPEDGFIYANIHLDFGEEKYLFKQLADYYAGANPPTNAYRDIADGWNADTNTPIGDGFKFDGGWGGMALGQESGAEDTVYNDNLFKKANGFMGFAIDANGAGSEDDAFAAGMKVKIVNKATGATSWSGTTDADGWYYGSFFATGKATNYKVTADTNKNGVFDSGDKSFDATLGGATKYAQVDFFGDWPGQGS
jgi:hypothetical protein